MTTIEPRHPVPGDIRFIVQGSPYVQTGFAFFEMFNPPNGWEFMIDMPGHLTLVSDPGTPYEAQAGFVAAEDMLNTNFPPNPLRRRLRVWEFPWDTDMELRPTQVHQFLYYVKHRRLAMQDHQIPIPVVGEPTRYTLKSVRWGVQVNEWRRGVEVQHDVVHDLEHMEIGQLEDNAEQEEEEEEVMMMVEEEEDNDEDNDEDNE